MSAGGKAFGFSAGDLPSLTPAELEQRLTEIEGTGAGWVRVDLGWTWVQGSGPGSYFWGGMDRVVDAARNHRLNVLLIPGYAPGWAAAPGCGQGHCAPRSADEFGTFVGEAAKRYAPRGVHSWEIWNEPNQPAFFGPTVDVGRYVSLLKAATTAIRRADAGATVLTAGLAPTFTQNGKLAGRDFLSAVYAQGGRDYFTGVAMHPYTFPAAPDSTANWTGWSQMRAMRDVMVANGDAGKKIWLTEYGAPTGGPGGTASGPSYSGSPDHVTEAYQASLATEGVRTAAATPWAGPLFWYGYSDLGTSTGTNENFFGLVRHDGSRKPAFAAFTAAVAAVPRAAA